MNYTFDPRQGLIIIRGELFGPSGSVIVRLALDTGATGTMINVGPLAAIGYDPSLVAGRVQVTTGSSVEFVPRIELAQIWALGEMRSNFSVLSHTLPPTAGVDGLLGLDFFRGKILTIDFATGSIRVC